MRYLYTLIFAIVALSGSAQSFALKTNLLYDATATANLGVEIGLGRRTSLDISGNYNGWYTDKDANEKIRHFLVQPEFRYYFCERFSGHYIGVHGLASEYNVCGDQWLLSAMGSLSNNSGDRDVTSRYQGTGYGAGFTYGYCLPISSRFNLEFSIGGGYIYLDYDQYGGAKCAPYVSSGSSHYFGITKVGISLVYIIK